MIHPLLLTNSHRYRGRNHRTHQTLGHIRGPRHQAVSGSGIMSDPTVTAYLTKLLCSNGGRLERNRLADLLDLQGEQIEQILQDEPLKFPKSSELVLARSTLRICTIYLNAKEEEEKCSKLHLCRQYLRGQCHPNRQPRCRLSHDVLSDHNRIVLKANKLTGLNEDEIKVLLFQNDSQLLPDNCRKYMYNKCDQGEDCTRLHVCSYFMQGECKNSFCKRSHNLLESKLLLTCSWLSQETIQNFQMLCVLTHNERQQVPREEPRNEEPRNARGMSRGRGRGKPRDRKSGSQDFLKGRSEKRWNKGLHISQQSDSRRPFQSIGGQRLGDEKYNRAGKNDYDSETRLHNLMDDWFSPNTVPLGNVPTRSSATSAGVTPQEATKSVPSSKGLVVESKVDEPELLSLPVEYFNSRIVHTLPSAPFNIPKISHDSPNTASVAPLLSVKSYQPYTHVPYPTTEQTRPAVSLPVTSRPRIPPTKGESLCQPTLLTAPSQPTSTTFKSGPSITSPKPLTTSSISLSSSTGDPFTQLKPLTESATLSNPPTVSSIPSLRSNKLVTSSFSSEPGIIPSIISAKPSSVSMNSKNSSIKSQSAPNQTPVKELCEKVCSPVAEPANVKSIPSTKSQSSLYFTSESPLVAKPKPGTSAVAGHLESSSSLPSILNFSSASIRADTPSRKHQTDVKPIVKPDEASGIQQPKPTNLMASKSQHTKNICPVAPQKYDKKLDELGTGTNNSQPNTKKVSSSILSSEPETIYLSKPTRTSMITAENQTSILNCQKMKDHYLTESEVCWRPEYLDFDRVKSLRAGMKSDANSSKQNPVYSTLKVVNYPPTWDMNAVPEVGYQNIPVPQMCDEFLNIAKMFRKTVLGHTVLKVWRVQNPTLWRAYQWQKDEMKKKNSGINVDERQLFHGTDYDNVTTICRDNFDWRVRGNYSILYGKGNYFAGDATYAHCYSPANRSGIQAMFVARVLVGDFIKGNAPMRSPPQKYRSTESYDSCVNSFTNPSIFVVFEKSQAYPEYVLEYKKNKKETKSDCLII